MPQLWDYRYLEQRLDACRSLFNAAAHPDVKSIYASYIAHYEAMLEALRARQSPLKPIAP